MALNFQRLEDITRALKSSNQDGRSFHVTFVYKGNKLICIANNTYKKLHRYHKFGEYKPRKRNSKNYVSGLHSEASALIKMGREDCSDLTFINTRLDNNGKPAISKPCPNCWRLIQSVGFKKFYYYDGKEYKKV